MNGDRYILQDRTPLPCNDLFRWGDWYAKADRQVADIMISGVRIRTMFIGINQQRLVDRPPLLFETMVYGGRFDLHRESCSTWVEAELQHQQVVDLVR